VARRDSPRSVAPGSEDDVRLSRLIPSTSPGFDHG